MSMTKYPKKLDYSDGRTKQAYKDETDINRILSRAQKTGTISHLAKHQPQYGDFADFDFFENSNKLIQGRQIFDELPSEIRREFNQSPAEFFQFVNNPENTDRLSELLPSLAQPGRQNISVRPPKADQELTQGASAPDQTKPATSPEATAVQNVPQDVTEPQGSNA